MDPHADGDYPGAIAPAREYLVPAGPVNIAVHEWGAADAAPLFLAHGGFDFARTYDVFAPLLARGGWRVVSWDQRGHGDSDQTELYSWDGDIRDAMAVMDFVTSAPAPVIGHSKGGALTLQLADAQPFRFSRLVNLDGLPYRRAIPDVADHERTATMQNEVEHWLDLRRLAATASRRPGTIDELATRRAKMNPRLSLDWLRHLVTVGARQDPDGWRWKIDPQMRFGGFGPWRPEWTITRLPGLGMPFLAVLGSEQEAMGFGTSARQIDKFLPDGGSCATLEGVGHFVHIEQPDLVASMVLDFIGRGA
ncbi:MAG: alpha/beta hydrolase [Ilumatobacteraceae bacterium]